MTNDELKQKFADKLKTKDSHTVAYVRAINRLTLEMKTLVVNLHRNDAPQLTGIRFGNYEVVDSVFGVDYLDLMTEEIDV